MLLGTDYLGRDVLSRFLQGGLTTVGISAGGTLLLYLVAAPLGLFSAVLGRAWDTVVMRLMDVLLCIPGLLLALLLINGLGGSIRTLLLCVVLAQLPSAVRVLRSAALEVATRPFVEVSRARGDSILTIARCDILPNITAVLVSDAGLRFRSAAILVTAVNFLGLGLAPPTADWGLMISENLNLLTLNPWAALAPAAALAALTISANAVADRLTARTLARTGSALAVAPA
jgi:peptide/nickel transport system permease protein